MPNLNNFRIAFVRRLLPVVVLLGSGFATYMAVTVWQVYRTPEVRADQEYVAIDDVPRNPFASASGTHLIAFVITASDCGWSSRPTVMSALGSVRDRLRSSYGSSYAQVSVIGVALDRDVDAGVRFLSDIGKGKANGAFDQVVVGGAG